MDGFGGEAGLNVGERKMTLVGEELQISIEKGKMLIIRLMIVGPVVEGRTQRDVWFEVNGEVHDFLGLYIYKLTHIRFERYRLKIKTPP